MTFLGIGIISDQICHQLLVTNKRVINASSPTLMMHYNIFQGYTAKNQLDLGNGENSQNKSRVPNFGEAFGLPEEEKTVNVVSNRNVARSITKKSAETKKKTNSQKHTGTRIHEPNRSVYGRKGSVRSSL